MEEEKLIQLYNKWAGEPAHKISALPKSGSNRKYFRIVSSSRSAIGVYNDDKKENISFLTFSKHFKNKKLFVPEIYAHELENDIYIQEDLGDENLYTFIKDNKGSDDFQERLTNIYKKIVDQLLRFQFVGRNDFDYSICYPRDSFDRQSMHWDLTYFKYYFLKLAKVPFDEQNLENDYETLIQFLLQADCDYFMYRDFQSRNIMISNNDLFFIDYQGGRKGALQYDLASLLYDAKADLTPEFREEILDYYISQVKAYKDIDEEQFRSNYYAYVLIRILQAFGAYGYRGFFERKEHFLLSIPYAINNIKWLLDNVDFPIEIPELKKALTSIIESTYLRELSEPTKRMTVRIQSFSFKRDIPYDEKGNGGGFVFDCRGLPNPGRFQQYKTQTGNDIEVIKFLDKEKDVKKFLDHVYSLTEISVKTYIERNFTDLMISFGCTGGQHRSVYCANHMAEYLRNNYDVKVELRHREQELKAAEKSN